MEGIGERLEEPGGRPGVPHGQIADLVLGGIERGERGPQCGAFADATVAREHQDAGFREHGEDASATFGQGGAGKQVDVSLNCGHLELRHDDTIILH